MMLTLNALKKYIEDQKDGAELVKKRDTSRHAKIPGLVETTKSLSEQLLRGGFEETSYSGLPNSLRFFYDSDNNGSDIAQTLVTPDNFKISGLRIKYGIDPSKSDAHLGHLLIPSRLREWQDIGGTVDLLLGSFTAMYGDPTDKKEDRTSLTLDETLYNARLVLKDILPVLDIEKTNVVLNHEWYTNMTVEAYDYLCKNFPLASLMQRSIFQDRDELSGGAFLYPTLQAFDSVMLGSHVGTGGKDQLLNELGGRDSQEHLGLENQMVYLAPLCMGTDGIPSNKMSKSLGNVVSLKDPLDTYATLFESMRSHPVLIKELGEKFTKLNLPKEISSKEEIEKYAKCVAEGIIISYFDKGGEDNISRQAITLYEERIGNDAQLYPQDRKSGLEIKGLDQQVDELLARRTSSIHRLIDGLEKRQIKTINRGNLAIEGFWSDAEFSQYEDKHERIASAYINVKKSKLHLDQIRLLDELSTMQKHGYHVKVIFGDYTSGTIEFSSLDFETATKNADMIINQIREMDLLDLEKATFHKNSTTYSNINVKSLLDMINQLNLKELEKEGLVTIDPKKYSRHTNQQAPNTLEFQYNIRKSMDMLMLGIDGDDVIVDFRTNDPYHRISEKLYSKVGLKAPNVKQIKTLDRKIGVEDIDSRIYVNGNPSKLYSDIMTINDNLLESYSTLSNNLEKRVGREEQTNKYLSRFDEATRAIIGDKMDFARSLVERFYGKDVAVSAERAYVDTKTIVCIDEYLVENGEHNVYAMIKKHVNPSISLNAYRGFLKQKAIKVNGEPIDANNPNIMIEAGKTYELSAGKKNKAFIKGH